MIQIANSILSAITVKNEEAVRMADLEIIEEGNPLDPIVWGKI